MKTTLGLTLPFALSVIAPLTLVADGTVRTNPPSMCTAPTGGCGCGEASGDADSVTNACIKVSVGLGETTPWTGSLPCALKIFADDNAPSIFTEESLHATLGGYTFKRLGQKTLADGETPAEVVFSHPYGEEVRFVFPEGESWGRPDPTVHIEMDERLMMVDAEGWAATSDPVYYDLYVGDGTRRRFLATNMTGALGSLVSVTDAHGATITPEEMGVDLVYGMSGVRQFLTPSRLANVALAPERDGYDVFVYAVDAPPQKDAATGLYATPDATPLKHLSIRSRNGGKRAVVTFARNGGDAKTYVFDYVMGEWSLARESGVKEEKERQMQDKVRAQIVKAVKSKDGELLARTEMNFKWMSWGFAPTNRVEGFGGVTDTTSWTYYTSGNGKGQVKTESRQSGLLIQYAYDNVDRVISETRSGPDMMTEVTTYDYTPVDANDPMLPVDTRPRTVVRKLNNIECERTYYVYSPLTNIVERVGIQGAAYGSTNTLRTVTTFYPAGGPTSVSAASGLVRSIRHEDGKLDLYDYSLVSNTWTRTVTHLHEQSPAPVSGKTTRDITITNARGETSETRTEAYIDGIWYTIARNYMTYNAEGKRTSLENLAGQITTTAWDCCHKVSETEPDGSTTTWDYDDEGRMIASFRLIPLDMTNVTWLTTCYRYDALGRQTATWQTNYAAQVGLPVARTRYDQLGRVIARVDQLGNTTTTTYSPDGRTVFVRNPNTSTRVTTRSASGDVLSITGTAVTPEFHTYGISPDGTRWSRTVQGETANSPRFTRRYENLLGQTIREERSGFQGAALAIVQSYDSLGRLVSTTADYEPTTEYTYDTFGNRIATTRTVGHGDPAAPQSETTEWRKSESLSNIAIIDGDVWLTKTNTVSSSGTAIAPLVSSSARQLTGLTSALPAHSRTTDIRGNVTENETLVDSSTVTSRQALPYATNKPLAISRYGVSLMDVSVSAVTNTVAYDSLGRRVANTDGRGNTRHTEYNSLGQRFASIDALGNRTVYAYDQFGHLASITDPLGNAMVYEYDLRGRKIYEGGATYPVRYTYDVFGNKLTMMTYRNESLGPDSGDVTTWLYDEASGSMTNKVYADGKGPTYSYTPDGKLSQRIWARGVVTDYAYDRWGKLTNTVYSDGTPTVSLAYDAFGRQTEARDAAGATTFLYDSFGSLTNETVIGVAGTNTIIRHWDNYGRSLGYSLVGLAVPSEPHCQSTLAYDPATGRLSSMLAAGSETPFTWNYLPGSDLKSSLTYPNGLTASWTYDANNQLLQVCNAFPTNIISQYDYIYDAGGRRISVSKSGTVFDHADTIAYGYNNRSELTNAVAAIDAEYRHAYAFDDIGNRNASFERGTNTLYAANSLNQYTSISNSVSLCEEFLPQFDLDGNQTLIQTSTGTWSVQYNGENRPILWISATNAITMSYDRKGRRISKNAQFYTYNEYLQIADNSGNEYVWDPVEPVATRPLVWMRMATNPPASISHFYTHDGSKNVSEILNSGGSTILHYDYFTFGALRNEYFVTNDFLLIVNPWRFSSEYFDDEIGAIYYNFRHYEPCCGRWSSRDPAGEDFGPNLVAYVNNVGTGETDVLGLFDDGGGQKVCMEHKLEIKVVNGGLSFQWVCVYWNTIKGHKDFENNGTVCPFDYTKEDYDWKSSPFTPWGIGRHFKDRQDIVGGTGDSARGHHSQDAVSPDENLLIAAINECNTNAFQSLMHQLQDTRVHNGNGFDANNWSLKFPFYEPGHAWHGGDPDHDDESQGWRWNLAEEDTRHYVKEWKAKCKLKDPCKCIWEKIGEKNK